MSSGKAFPPHIRIFYSPSENVLDLISFTSDCIEYTYLSKEEHSALLEAKDKLITSQRQRIERLVGELVDREINLEKKIEKLKWQLSQFKCVGTDQCQSCEGGRVSLFMANQECISCNPRSYDTYEQREALAGGKDEPHKRRR